MGFAIKYFDELVADDFAFLLRINDTGQLCQESLTGVHGHQVQAQLFFQGLLYFLEFVLTQHTVVDENAGESLSQGAMYQGCSYGGIYSSGEGADGPACLPHGVFDLANGFMDEMLRCPIGACATDVIN